MKKKVFNFLSIFPHEFIVHKESCVFNIKLPKSAVKPLFSSMGIQGVVLCCFPCGIYPTFFLYGVSRQSDNVL